MRKISRRFKVAKLCKSAFLLLAVFTLAGMTSGCKQAPKFPGNLYTWMLINAEDGSACVQYRIADPVTFELEVVKIHPPETCPLERSFCYPAEEQVKINDWAKEMNAWAAKKCD